MSITIFVKCVSTNDLQWRQEGSNDWQQLQADKNDAPTIGTTSSDDVTFEFRKDGSSDHGVDYKECPDCSVQEVHSKSGPSVVVRPDHGNHVYFARNESASNQRWYIGHVRVSKPSR